ncbi:MAG: nucleotide exchange factor GrpE [Armatimonadota bacterium]
MDREWKRSTEGDFEDPSAPTEHGERRSDIPVETIESLRAEVERLRVESEHNWQQFLRTAADLENYRKQAARQREEAVAATRRALLDVILGVVDNLERALEHADGVAAADGAGTAVAIADGIRLAHRQVLDVLRSMGVRPMDTIGTPFDPRRHDAAEAVRATGKAPGTIVGEVQRGYLLGDEVLRPARVRVAQ